MPTMTHQRRRDHWPTRPTRCSFGAARLAPSCWALPETLHYQLCFAHGGSRVERHLATLTPLMTSCCFVGCCPIGVVAVAVGNGLWNFVALTRISGYS